MLEIDFQEIERQNSENPTGFSKYSKEYIQRRINREKVIKELSKTSYFAKIVKILLIISLALFFAFLLLDSTVGSIQTVFLSIFVTNTYLLIKIQSQIRSIRKEIEVLLLCSDTTDVTSTVFATYIEEQLVSIHEKLDEIKES